MPSSPPIGGLAGLAFGLLFGLVSTRRAGTVFAMISLGIVVHGREGAEPVIDRVAERQQARLAEQHVVGQGEHAWASGGAAPAVARPKGAGLVATALPWLVAAAIAARNRPRGRTTAGPSGRAACCRTGRTPP
jgi:ABC-type branched-subunit amino acid transport system permease subunit